MDEEVKVRRKVGRPRKPPRSPEDQKLVDQHRSRGIMRVKSKKPTLRRSHLTPRQRLMLKKTLMLKGEKVIGNPELERERRLGLFVDEFARNGGNATKAAMFAFDLTNVKSANVAGSKVLAEVKGMAQLYLESKGVTYGKLLDKAVEKMDESKTTEWWDRLMKMAGYEDFISKGAGAPVSVNIIGSQKDFISDYIQEGEIVEEGK